MIICISSTADPAPLEITEVASHVIAAFHLLYFSFAFWAVGDMDFARCPLLKLFIRSALTACKPAMPLFSALEAYALTALGALYLGRFEIIGSNVTLTVNFWAPSH